MGGGIAIFNVGLSGVFGAGIWASTGESDVATPSIIGPSRAVGVSSCSDVGVDFDRFGARAERKDEYFFPLANRDPLMGGPKVNALSCVGVRPILSVDALREPGKERVLNLIRFSFPSSSLSGVIVPSISNPSPSSPAIVLNLRRSLIDPASRSALDLRRLFAK